MSEINSLDIKEFITNAVSDVFDTMLSMEVESIAAGQTENYNGGRIVGTVSLAGKVLGNLNLHVGEEFAMQITAAMLGMELDEIISGNERHSYRQYPGRSPGSPVIAKRLEAERIGRQGG